MRVVIDNNIMYISGLMTLDTIPGEKIFTARFDLGYLEYSNIAFFTWTDNFWRRPIVLSSVSPVFESYSPIVKSYLPAVNSYFAEFNHLIK